MRIRYQGHKTVKNELGLTEYKYGPEIQIFFSDKESDLANKRLDFILSHGYRCDIFGNEIAYNRDNMNVAYIQIHDREEADYIISLWKEAKETIKN